MLNVQDCKHFLQDIIPVALEKLQADTKPKWGSMEAQEMVEHVAIALKGGYALEFGADKEPKPAHTQAKIAFLEQNTPYPKGIPSPFHKEGKPAYVFASLDDAKKNLVEQVKVMYAFFDKPENLAKFFFHPFFGKLNFEEVQKFNYKHISHHFEQFDLL
jgi:hypothetical protein